MKADQDCPQYPSLELPRKGPVSWTAPIVGISGFILLGAQCDFLSLATLSDYNEAINLNVSVSMFCGGRMEEV